jgi:hypothetical protein
LWTRPPARRRQESRTCLATGSSCASERLLGFTDAPLWSHPRVRHRKAGAISSSNELRSGRWRFRRADPRWRNARRRDGPSVVHRARVRGLLPVLNAKSERAGGQRLAALGRRRISERASVLRCRRVPGILGVHGVRVVRACCRTCRGDVLMSITGNGCPRHVEVEQRQSQQDGSDAFQMHSADTSTAPTSDNGQGMGDGKSDMIWARESGPLPSSPIATHSPVHHESRPRQ